MSDLESINKHLEELRKRILRIVLVIGIITVVVLTCHAEPIEVRRSNHILSNARSSK